MHTELTTLPGRHDHPPQPVSPPQPHPVRRVGLLDRTALHLGIALIKWGRRPLRTDDRDQLASAREAYLARQESERLRTQYEAMYLTRIL
jgi:hypothetical protein